MLVTNSLTDCRLENLIDVTLAFEYANLKLVEVFIVADIYIMMHVCVSRKMSTSSWESPVTT